MHVFVCACVYVGICVSIDVCGQRLMLGIFFLNPSPSYEVRKGLLKLEFAQFT